MECCNEPANHIRSLAPKAVHTPHRPHVPCRAAPAPPPDQMWGRRLQPSTKRPANPAHGFHDMTVWGVAAVKAPSCQLFWLSSFFALFTIGESQLFPARVQSVPLYCLPGDSSFGHVNAGCTTLAIVVFAASSFHTPTSFSTQSPLGSRFELPWHFLSNPWDSTAHPSHRHR